MQDYEKILNKILRNKKIKLLQKNNYKNNKIIYLNFADYAISYCNSEALKILIEED